MPFDFGLCSCRFLDGPAAPLKDAVFGERKKQTTMQRGCKPNPAQLSPLVAQLFPPGVIAAELHGPGDLGLLDPIEADTCRGFAPKRIAEFAAGRLCARRALRELGITAFPIRMNVDRSPRWPDGITGSISHGGLFCSAVAGSAGRFGSLGVDAETLGRVTQDLDSHLFTDNESAGLAALPECVRLRAATIVFSAKEAFYKCQYAITQRWLDFRDVSLQLTSPDTREGDFTVRSSAAGLEADLGVGLPIRGRFAIAGNLVVTGISLRGDG